MRRTPAHLHLIELVLQLSRLSALCVGLSPEQCLLYSPLLLFASKLQQCCLEGAAWPGVMLARHQGIADARYRFVSLP